MNLVQLEYFVKIAECGSITKAAKELYISQPNLTRSIANLEAEYNVQFLERTPKGATLTPRGREFLVYAKNLLNSSYMMRELFQEEKRMSTRHLHVASQSFDFLYGLLEDFYQENGTTTNVLVEEIDRGSIVAHVEDRTVDIGILVLCDEDDMLFRASLKKNMEIHELAHSSVYACLSGDHPLAGKEGATLAELKQYPQILLNMNQSSRVKVTQGEKKGEKNGKEQVIFCNTLSSGLHFVRHSMGVLYITKWVLEQVRKYSDIWVIPLRLVKGDENSQVNHLAWIKRKDEELSDSEIRFVEMLSAMF